MKKERMQLKGDPFKYMERMSQAKVDFEVEITNSSGKIILPDREMYFGVGFSKKAFALFSKTKSHLSAQTPPPIPEGRINYVSIYPPVNRTNKLIKNIINIDIQAAYHTAAYTLGYFSEELYNLHNSASKEDRLKAFGATAKNAQLFRYKEGEIVDIIPKQSPLRSFFINSAAYVGEVMSEAREALGEDFLFFWVDGVFLKHNRGNVPKVKKIFRDYGFEVSSEKLKFVIFNAFKKSYSLNAVDIFGYEKTYQFPRRDYFQNKRDRYFSNKKVS